MFPASSLSECQGASRLGAPLSPLGGLRKGEAYRDPLEDRAQQDPVTELA